MTSIGWCWVHPSVRSVLVYLATTCHVMYILVTKDVNKEEVSHECDAMWDSGDFYHDAILFRVSN